MNWDYVTQFGVAGAVTVALSLLSQGVFATLGDPWPGWYIGASIVHSITFFVISFIIWGRYDDEARALRNLKKELEQKEQRVFKDGKRVK